MRDERKEELGQAFLLNSFTPIEELNKLEIQEIIYLIYTGRKFKENKVFVNDNIDEKIVLFYNVLRDKLLNADKLYLVYDKNTNYPYLDANDCVWLFSKEEIGINIINYVKKDNLFLDLKEIKKDELMSTYGNLYILGIDKILVDNSEYSTEINREFLIKNPEFNGSDPRDIAGLNPKLQHNMIRFFQLLKWEFQFEGKKNALRSFENNMIKELISSKFLVPVMNSNEKEIEFATLVNQNNTVWLPAFTDWFEFEKMYDKNTVPAKVLSFNDLMEVSKSLEGTVVNCCGIDLRINDKTKKNIDNYIVNRQNNIKECIIEKNTKVKLGNPKNIPGEFINILKNFLKDQYNIKKAYLKLMIKDDELSYLLLLDTNKKDLNSFKEISNLLNPFLEDKMLYIATIQEFGIGAIRDSKAIYER